MLIGTKVAVEQKNHRCSCKQLGGHASLFHVGSNASFWVSRRLELSNGFERSASAARWGFVPSISPGVIELTGRWRTSQLTCTYNLLFQLLFLLSGVEKVQVIPLWSLLGEWRSATFTMPGDPRVNAKWRMIFFLNDVARCIEVLRGNSGWK